MNRKLYMDLLEAEVKRLRGENSDLRLERHRIYEELADLKDPSRKILREGLKMTADSMHQELFGLKQWVGTMPPGTALESKP